LVRKIGTIGFGLLRPEMGYFLRQRLKEWRGTLVLICGRHPPAKLCERSVALKGNQPVGAGAEILSTHPAVPDS
jgi:hypothetical protein